MTLFVIILTVFIVCQIRNKVKIKNKAKQYQQSIKSNAQTQFDIGCDAIRMMGEEYRNLSTNKTYKERFKHLPPTSAHEINNLLELRFDNRFSNINEEKWLLAVGVAGGFKIDNNLVKEIYSTDIWNQIPSQMSDSFKVHWLSQFQPNICDKDLDYYLNKAIDFKNQILYNKESGCYKDYNDAELIDTIAQKYGMPSEKELHILGKLPYSNINNLAIDYMNNQIRKKGFCPAMIGGYINAQPRTEDREKGYSALSYGEQQQLNLRQKNELYQKYYK